MIIFIASKDWQSRKVFFFFGHSVKDWVSFVLYMQSRLSRVIQNIMSTSGDSVPSTVVICLRPCQKADAVPWFISDLLSGHFPPSIRLVWVWLDLWYTLFEDVWQGFYHATVFFSEGAHLLDIFDRKSRSFEPRRSFALRVFARDLTRKVVIREDVSVRQKPQWCMEQRQLSVKAMSFVRISPHTGLEMLVVLHLYNFFARFWNHADFVHPFI